MKKAIIAMSGGVDSSVAAYLMQKQGYDCTGVTMKLFQGMNSDSKRTCCSAEDALDAQCVARQLKIPFYVFNFTSDFQTEVIDRFVTDYENGRTPNPCIDCNKYLKFGKLCHRADEMGIDVVATGHYAKIEEKNGRMILKKASDRKKDQSYVLYAMTQSQLKRVKFPLGSLTKTEVRELAEQQGFYNSNKPDSQDICFVPDGDYASFLEKHTGTTYRHGDFVKSDGTVLGEHKGIVRYTIGQRKGLGISSDKPLYVCEIRPKENKIVLGDNNDLFSKELDVCDFNWIYCATAPETSFRASVRIRYHHKEQPATIIPVDYDRIHVIFDEPQRAITKGQAAVLYDDDTVIGGGTIT